MSVVQDATQALPTPLNLELYYRCWFLNVFLSRSFLFFNLFIKLGYVDLTPLCASAILLFSVVLIAVVLGALNLFSRNQSHAQQVTGEYSLSSLIFPYKKELGWNNVWLVLFSPYVWVFELLAICLLALLYFFIVIESTATLSLESILLAFVASGAIALAMSLACLALVWYFDVREREPLHIVFSFFLWGGTAGFIAGILNELFSYFGGSGAEIILIVLFAPFFEELIKGFALLVTQFHHEWDQRLDGLIYGFFIGCGFAFIENWGYFSMYSPGNEGLFAWLLLVVIRTGMSGVMHGIMTGTTGAVISFINFRKFPKFITLFAFIPAVVLHVLFNGITTLPNFLALCTFPYYAGVLILFIGLYVYLKKLDEKQPL